ncbi:Glycosyltransferase involved in cell wall bisynthesis [Rhizobium sp. RU20A]|uniref:glycosyltransferase family 4 protein n=1 Tax=Rhizobium sp. RU20A TaxID=1907412 RepID=UPI0009569118|nr:glycosyltransferase family 4 protein [Rhizobium sp. RU20A]SIP95743.1 Glycosyltransferase involved in cell wall bisynthesis [Rhizobium sp. RU20A]
MQHEPPLRIIHCFRSPIGGIFRHVRDLAEAQSRSGHLVGIVCDSSTGGAYEDQLFEALKPYLALGLVRLPIRRSVGLSDLGAFWKSFKEVKSLQPDVLHGHGAKGGVLARLIGSLLRVYRYRVARLYSPHGGSLHYDKRKLSGRLIFLAERLQESLTDAIVFVCDYEKSVYEEKVGPPRIRCERIYNGVTEQEFEKIFARQDAVDFLFIGMLRDLKGPDVFIDAFARTERAVGRPLSALMVGDGPDRDRYEETMTALGLGKRIDLLPAMRTRDAFTFARIVVVPSRAEAMPYIVLEATAAEKPIIASRVGGIPEILGPDNIALATPGDAAGLAAIMSAALTDPDWTRRAAPDRDRLKQNFSVTTMSDRMSTLYRACLKATRRRRS